MRPKSAEVAAHGARSVSYRRCLKTRIRRPCVGLPWRGLACRSAASQAADTAHVEWRFYSGDNGSTKYSPLDQINKSNVGNLKIAWRRPQVDPSRAAGPDRPPAQQLPLDADHGRRRALRVERRRPRRGLRSGDRQDAVGAEARRRRHARQRQSRRRVSGARAPTRASSPSAIGISTRSTRRPASRSRPSATTASSISAPTSARAAPAIAGTPFR